MIIKAQREQKWWALKEEWNRIQGTREAEITAVRILNQGNEKSETFNIGEDIIVKADFIVHQETKEPHFGAAIFREDGLYCYGPNTIFDGHRIERLKTGKGWFSIRYRKVNLMPADYRLSIAIWDRKEVLAHSYHSGFYKFKITGSKNHGELLKLTYQWKSNGQLNVLSEDLSKISFVLRDLRNRWKERFDSEEAKIISLELIDEKGNSRDSFKTQEKLLIRVSLRINNKEAHTYLWLGIFRKDGIYCNGAGKRLGENEESVSLFYPEVPLLPADYRVSVGIWQEERRKFLSLHHGIYPFTITFEKLDHGVVYLEHDWQWKLP